MTEAEFKKHLDAAEKSPEKIAAAVSGLSAEALRFKPSPDKWCVLEILGHLADVEIVYGYRLRQMLADEKPVIAPMDQNAWAKNLGYMDVPSPELVAFYGLARHHNLRLLRRLKSSDFEKSAFHPEMQRAMTVAEIVERMSEHGTGHHRQIEQLNQAAKGKAKTNTTRRQLDLSRSTNACVSSASFTARPAASVKSADSEMALGSSLATPHRTATTERCMRQSASRTIPPFPWRTVPPCEE